MKKIKFKLIQEKKITEIITTGLVTSVNIKGFGPNSAQLLFTVLDSKSGKSTPIMATSYPDYEPQLFSSVADFVTAAYFAKCEISVGYYTVPNETSRVIEVYTV